jgi:hypothetical protein
VSGKISNLDCYVLPALREGGHGLIRRSLTEVAAEPSRQRHKFGDLGEEGYGSGRERNVWKILAGCRIDTSPFVEKVSGSRPGCP